MKLLALSVLVLAGITLAACDRDAHHAPHDDAIEAMAHAHHDETPVATAAAMEEPDRPVSTREVVYGTVDGEAIRGYLAVPDGAGENLPGVLVIHEWWGLNDNIRAMTRRLAGEGYAALAVDLFGESADSPEGARVLVQQVNENRAAAEANLGQGIRFLQDSLAVNRMGVIGWCFGGSWALNTALIDPEAIHAAVIYYGRMETDAQRLARLDAPVLGIFGTADAGIPLDHVRAVETRLDSLGKPVDFHLFDGADHAFANPSGTRYDEEAARRAWKLTVDFLGRHLRN